MAGNSQSSETSKQLRELSRHAILLLQRDLLVPLNDSSRRALDDLREPILNRPLSELSPRVQSFLEVLRKDSAPATPLSIQLETKEGQELSFWVYAARLPGAEASPAVVATFVEYNDGGAWDQDLHHLEQLAGAGIMAASMAHEIRNSLVAGKAFVDLLLEKEPESEMGNLVRRELQRASDLASQMLRLAGPARETHTRFSATRFLDHCLRLIEPQLASRSISLTRRFDATTDWLNGNEQELQQGIVNLLLNALDAMGSGGVLTVATRSVVAKEFVAPQLEIMIEDTGPGIAAENLDRLFEPFFTTKSEGTGLGLAITRRVIERHQGRIRVESPPGHGATFIISLPCSATP